MSIFGGYDQAALDAQYNNGDRVPDYPDYIERWTRDSEATRAGLDCRLDLAYGPGERQRLDIFPASSPGAPLLVFIHGGYWQRLDKNVFSYLADAFVAAGIGFAAIGYPLAPAAGLDEISESARAAFEWLGRNAAEHGLDPDRMFVAGHSAGGHLTAAMLATDWAARDGVPADLVKGGCAISGLYDLEPIRLCYLNKVLGMDEAVARRNSPVHDLAGASGDLIVTVGGDESEEFHRQQADLVAGWRARGLEPAEIPQPGKNHFSVVDQLAAPDSALHKAVIRQILG